MQEEDCRLSEIERGSYFLKLLIEFYSTCESSALLKVNNYCKQTGADYYQMHERYVKPYSNLKYSTKMMYSAYHNGVIEEDDILKYIDELADKY